MSLISQFAASMGAGMEIGEPFPAAPLALALWQGLFEERR
jgi:hypothetical protein